MPKRTDINKIAIIGSGPIVIGQGCEFDYSGTQAVRALKADGYDLVLINSNPATIMTDPELAPKTYIEPLTPDAVELVLRREKPDALLPTLGGQTALNIAVELADRGVLGELGIELIGASVDAIKISEDREKFQQAMDAAGIARPRGGLAHSVEEAEQLAREIGYPVVVRPSFTLGGTGGGTAFNVEELLKIASGGIQASPSGEVLIEESLRGWKEYELELMRDCADNVVIVCSIENLDPMGVHTGDSITVAPQMTLTDREYQKMRDESIKCIRAIGIDTGGSNIQFAVHPDDGRMLIIEMNPRVSRSSALASKATGFPIAKIAAKLAVGFTLDEIPNDITRETMASFEPTLDYVIVKIPRWTFEKFPEADQTLTTMMKSVGEVMAIGSTFNEALQKGIRSLEIGRFGLGSDGADQINPHHLEQRIRTPNVDRIFYVKYAIGLGATTEEIYERSGIDPWFIEQIRRIVRLEREISGCSTKTLPAELCLKAKRAGFSDVQLANLTHSDEAEIREFRVEHGITPVYKTVDTCAAEFEAYTPYHYSTYETENEAVPSEKKKVVILGSGPNRIGQGIEFDYCCVRCSIAFRNEGYETIMVNCNPETVSTDYDISNKLYFEPLTLEDVLNIIELEKPEGVVVMFGGQTPLKLAKGLAEAGIKILGTSHESIALAEDREKFNKILEDLDIRQPAGGTARNFEGARKVAERIGYPVLVRPSFVLGGRAMAIVYNEKLLKQYMTEAVDAAEEYPVLIDKFLEDAFEYDLDAVSDGKDLVIGGIMQHIEEAGIHSGDSACVIPAYRAEPAHLTEMRKVARVLAVELGVVGLMNVQYAVKDGVVYVIEVNPRASRTVPFVSKATGLPLVTVASRVLAGKSLAEQGITEEPQPAHISIKEAVLPFARFTNVDPLLGPEMKSTGEVMGIAATFGEAFAKSQAAAGMILPVSGNVFISVNDSDKQTVLGPARTLVGLGFNIVATSGTYKFLQNNGLPARMVHKVEMGRPNGLDYVANNDVALLINTPLGKKSQYDDYSLRRAALMKNIPYVTTMSAASAAIDAIETLAAGKIEVAPLQEYLAAL